MVRHKILGQKLRSKCYKFRLIKKRGYKKKQGLNINHFKKIVKVVEALERVDENGKDPDFETVKEILNELLERRITCEAMTDQ